MARAPMAGVLAMLFAGACATSPPSSGAGVGSSGTGEGGTTSTAVGGASFGGDAGIIGSVGGTLIVAGTSGTAGSGGIDACAAEVATGELVPVDMFVMLDISSSMLDMTESGTDKWTAVKSALQGFFADAGSSGLGVGIQYFPLEKPGAPDACGSDADCGDSGPCFLELCWSAYINEGRSVVCDEEADCRSGGTDVGPCTAFGQCSGNRDYTCQTIGLPCISATENAGICVEPESICLNTAQCTVDSYATPAVAIATLPDVAPQLVASIEAQVPSGPTPTGPALSGAIQQAQSYAAEHPGHTVVTVLATDGLPTRCEPVEVAAIGEIAAAAASGTPPVRTFVIGVFGPDETDAQANLDTIALGGGTDTAFIVDTAQNVADQFLGALNEIRGTSLACEFQIPQPTTGDNLDYGLVNVAFGDGAVTTPIYQVAGAAQCMDESGWYYDDHQAPTRIVLCPASCEAIGAVSTASVEIQLGCTTVVR